LFLGFGYRVGTLDERGVVKFVGLKVLKKGIGIIF